MDDEFEAVGWRRPRLTHAEVNQTKALQVLDQQQKAVEHEAPAVNVVVAAGGARISVGSETRMRVGLDQANLRWVGS